MGGGACNCDRRADTSLTTGADTVCVPRHLWERVLRVLAVARDVESLLAHGQTPDFKSGCGDLLADIESEVRR